MNKENFKDTMHALIELSTMPDSTPVEAPFSMYFAGMLICVRVSMPEDFSKAVKAFNKFEESQAEELLENFLNDIRHEAKNGKEV